MIKTLIFDLGRVLVDFDFSLGCEALARRTHRPAADILAVVQSSGLAPQLEAGQLSAEEFVARMTGLLGVTVSYEDFAQDWCAIFLPGTLIPERWVRQLRTRHRTLLLSNTNAIHFAMLRRTYPILDHFDAYVLSHEVKAMKPDPRIYAAAVEAAGCAPEECFFTDDMPGYVEGARRAGLDAVQFTGADRLRADLAARGIVIEE